MAINPSTNATMSGRITAADADYPYGSTKDETAPGAEDGTPYFKARADDLFGLMQWLLDQAGITPSGNADTVLASDYGDALDALFVRSTNLVSFTSSGTYSKPAGLKSIKVTVVGGGGGSGGSAAGETSGSGDSAGIAIKIIDASAIGSTETVTIGLAGAAGADGGNNNGGDGGDSSFGAHCTGEGGGGGEGSNNTVTENPGTGLNGDINITGATGSEKTETDAFRQQPTPGFHGSLGAGGPGRGYSPSTTAGVAGTKGIIIIEELF